MKTKSLQFGKAMSAALFVLLLVVVGTKNALAQTQVATLQHGDDVSVYYGTNALVEAHTAAQTGDIITLSSGSYMPTTITKAITLRGAGCDNDTVAGIFPTIITGTITGNVANDTTFLTIEGIWFSGAFLFQTLSQPRFTKCNFVTFGYTSSGNGRYMTNAQFTNCRIRNFFSNSTSGTNFVNSIVWWSRHVSSSNSVDATASINAINSYIGTYSDHTNLSAFNCIIQNICQYSGSGWLKGNSVANNCLGIKNSSGNSPFNCATYGCHTFNNTASVFETFDSSNYSWIVEKLILKVEIANTYLGTDGTEVGIYGGIMPYSVRPTYMILKRCNVANKSTIDGKLSVDIEVVTEEE